MCRGRDNVSTQCAPGLTGPLCKLCEDRGSVRREPPAGHNGTGVDECFDCAENGLLGVYLGWVLLVVGVLVALLVLLVLAHRYLPEELMARLARLWHASKPHNKLKICVGYYSPPSPLEPKALAAAGRAHGRRLVLEQ